VGLLKNGGYIVVDPDGYITLTDLGMEPTKRRDHICLKEAILMAVQDPDSWQAGYLEYIGQRENVTRERVRQMLHKAAWKSWSVNSKEVLAGHFNHPIQTDFEYAKPNHIELITLISKEMEASITRETKKEMK
jgi:hypothetical protein